MIAHSFTDPRAVLVVADQRRELVGLGLAVIDPRSFWRDFALHQPRLLPARLVTVVRRKLARRATPSVEPADCSQFLSPASGRSWGESSPQLAHVLIVTLRPELRGAGAGPQLFAALLSELAQRGATRFDSRIAKSNLASVRMCHRMGIAVEDAPGTFFVTADLPWRPNGQAR
jgi:hypothetical protein